MLSENSTIVYIVNFSYDGNVKNWGDFMRGSSHHPSHITIIFCD